MRCWRRPRPPSRTRRSLPRCCHCRTMDAIPRSIPIRSSGGKEHWKRLTRQMEALSRSNPVLMIFEDAHWADPTSLEAFGRAVDRIANLRVLLIVTFRPEFESPWIGRPHVTFLSINRLARARHRRHDRRGRRQQVAARQHPKRHHRAHRRHPAVRGGNDQGGAGGGERRRRRQTSPQRFRLLPWPCPQACTHR